MTTSISDTAEGGSSRTRSPSAQVLVVGGGHAGCEAALASARRGFSTLLVTGAVERIAAMSCNPAVGGVGKTHLVKELDALGGEMARVADATGIQFRTLNASRGPAVRATRCQSDMDRYRAAMARVVLNTPNLRVRQDDVVGIVVEDGRCVGVHTRHSGVLAADRVILTTGTFLGGKLHLGTHQTPGGRAGESPMSGLSQSLVEHGFQLGRLKTGTCPRIDVRTIDLDRLTPQPPDDPPPRFAFDSGPPPLPQVSCYLARTTAACHRIIADAVQNGLAPLFNGQLDSKGPRYCPSIEDKVIRFPHNDSHQIFLEPQGLDTPEVYPAGLSTSLPPEVQLDLLHAIPGLEEVEVTRWGYAVEYDFVDPIQLLPSLETKLVKNLFTAGQLNGTTGYEEAAIQGFLAGVNATLSLEAHPPLVLGRHEAYAGVLVDDLVTLGTDEPYRMFTSRAEHRLILREDNAYARLADQGRQLGLLDQGRHEHIREMETRVDRQMARLRTVFVPASDSVNAALASVGSAPLKHTASLAQLLVRPEMTIDRVEAVEAAALPSTGHDGSTDSGPDSSLDAHVRYRVQVELKYAVYIARAEEALAKQKALYDCEVPASIYDRRLPGMTNEVYERLRTTRPQTLGQAARIRGMTPAAIGLLAVEIERRLYAASATASAETATEEAREPQPHGAV